MILLEKWFTDQYQDKKVRHHNLVSFTYGQAQINLAIVCLGCSAPRVAIDIRWAGLFPRQRP